MWPTVKKKGSQVRLSVKKLQLTFLGTFIYQTLSNKATKTHGWWSVNNLWNCQQKWHYMPKYNNNTCKYKTVYKYYHMNGKALPLQNFSFWGEDFTSFRVISVSPYWLLSSRPILLNSICDDNLSDPGSPVTVAHHRLGSPHAPISASVVVTAPINCTTNTAVDSRAGV